MSAPKPRRSLTQAKLTLSKAWANGVAPRLSRASMSAPAMIKALSMAAVPRFRAPIDKGPMPSALRRLGLSPKANRLAAQPKLPCALALWIGATPSARAPRGPLFFGLAESKITACEAQLRQRSKEKTMADKYPESLARNAMASADRWVAGEVESAKVDWAWGAAAMDALKARAAFESEDAKARYDDMGPLGRAGVASGASLDQTQMLRDFLMEVFALENSGPQGPVIVISADSVIRGSIELPPEILDLAKRLRQMRRDSSEDGSKPAPPAV